MAEAKCALLGVVMYVCMSHLDRKTHGTGPVCTTWSGDVCMYVTFRLEDPWHRPSVHYLEW